MDSNTKKIVLLVGLGILILGLLFLAPALFAWNSFFGETDFDREYRENLERSKEMGTQNQPGASTVPASP
jgi:hypothetical protein